jgi:hypothetical protein
MKHKILTLYLLIAYSVMAFSQELIEGKLWVVATSEEVKPQSNSNRTLSLQLNQLFDDYGVYSYSPAFQNAKNELLKNTYEVKFNGSTETFYTLLSTQFTGAFSHIKIHYETEDISVYDPVDWMWADPNNEWMWHLERIKAGQAWDITLGDPNVTIAILDTDIDIGHPDIASEILLPFEPYDSTQFDCNPSNSHGTTVASFATGETTEIGQSPNGQLASIGFNTRFIFYHAWVTTSGYLQRAHHASMVMGVDVITSSAGGWRCWGGPDPIEEAAVQEILDNGTVIVMPAGNGFNGTHCDNGNDGIQDPWYPLHPNYDERIIMVTSTNYNDEHTNIGENGIDYTHSHFPSVDICSPGLGTLGAMPENCGQNEWPYYGDCNGTSFATPIVAGVAALMKSVNKGVSPAEIQEYIKRTADPVVDADLYPGLIGTGRINAYESVKLVNECQYTEIIEDEDWSSDRNIYCGIIVRSDAALTINSEVKMSKNSEIIVEKGGKLILDGGKITKMHGHLWQGIYVQGDINLRQSPESNMGKLVVKNGGIIEYAHTAVNNFALNEAGNIEWNSTGGIIQTSTGAQFLNNKRDVQFLSYQNYSGSNPVNDKSFFKETSFKVTELLPDDQKPMDRITMWQVDGVKIRGCEFSSSTEYVTGLRGNGIGVIDASFVVESYNETPTTFTNLSKGIEAKNYNDYYTISVSEAQFNDLHAGIFMLDVMEASITHNTFNIFTDSQYKSPYGLYMVGCSGYEVEDNVFTGVSLAGSTSLGVVIKNVELEDDNAIYRNEFYDLHSAVLVMGKNGSTDIMNPTGLEILCNRFNNSLSDYTDFGLTNNGVVSFYQGSSSLDGSEGPAGNLFSAMACSDENSLYVSDNSLSYIYNHHSNVEATPGEDCYTANKVWLQDSEVEYDLWEQACPEESNGGGDELEDKLTLVAASKDQISDLKLQYQSVVDGGETSSLSSTINDPFASSYEVRTELIEASPNLSDEVLLETITRNPSLNAWHMAEIMMANAPVNPLVWEAFVAQTTLPDFLFNYVVYYQENGGTTQKKELEMAIKTQVDIKEKASSDYVRGQMLLEDNADKNQKILDLYEVDEDNRAIRRKIAALSSAGQHDDAETLLQAYSQNSAVDAYPQVQGIITTMNATGNEPSSAEKSLLYSIAEGNKFGKYKAQALLNYLDGAEFEYPIVLPDLGQKSLKGM